MTFAVLITIVMAMVNLELLSFTRKMTQSAAALVTRLLMMDQRGQGSPAETISHIIPENQWEDQVSVGDQRCAVEALKPPPLLPKIRPRRGTRTQDSSSLSV
jgi:hypothetical protein